VEIDWLTTLHRWKIGMPLPAAHGRGEFLRQLPRAFRLAAIPADSSGTRVSAPAQARIRGSAIGKSLLPGNRLHSSRGGEVGVSKRGSRPS